MGIRIKDEPHKDHLRIILEGELELSFNYEIWDQILEMCEKHQLLKVLLDARNVIGSLNFMERFTLASVFAAKYIKARMTEKIPPCLFAVAGNQPLVDPKRFGQNVAKNLGTPVKVFTDLREALMWLGVEGSEGP